MKASIEDLIIMPAESVLQVMQGIDQNASSIALVVDEDRRLLGTVTDGDIRRAFLQGAALDSLIEPYMHRAFTAVSDESGRAEVLDLMRARAIEQVPIVDDEGRLIGLHTLREILGSEDRPNIAVIMAGGLGMRLRPVTEHTPKPMIKVAGRPILERLVLHLVGSGITRIYIAVNHLSHVIEEYFGNGAAFGCRIEYLREKEPLGTGGALSLLETQPKDPMIVMNGDLITQVDISSLLKFHEFEGCRATMVVKPYGHQIPFGCVDIKNRRVVGLEEKPIIEHSVNTGIYVIDPLLLEKIPTSFYPITDLLEGCIKEGTKVGAFEMEDEWLDVGQSDQLKPGKTT